jgi:hypothetical protein
MDKLSIITHNKIIDKYKDSFKKVGNVISELKDKNIYLEEQNIGLKNHIKSSNTDETTLVSTAGVDSDEFTNDLLKSLGYTDDRIQKTRERAQNDLKRFLEKK